MANEPKCNPAVEACTRIWHGDRHTAAKTSRADLEGLQKRFRGRLTIRRMNDGGLVILPDNPGDYTEFHVFMAQNTPFTSQVIGEKHLTPQVMI